MSTSVWCRRGWCHNGISVCLVLLGSLPGCGVVSNSSNAPIPGGRSGGGNGSGGNTAGSGEGSSVAAFFFGMHEREQVHGTPFAPSVNVPIAGIRLWDSHTSWATTNIAPGTYDWTDLDNRVSQAIKANPKVDVLYDFARTPAWAQCANDDPTCGSGDTTIVCAYAQYATEGGTGQCFPPNDLRTDGSGTNQHWIDWVTAVVTRYKGKISYYEIWNEPNISEMWQGTDAQVVRMAGDARCIIKGDKGCNSNSHYSQTGVDPNAKVLTPAFGNPVADSMSRYLTTVLNGGEGNGGAFADIIAFHGYPGQKPAEHVLNIYNSLNRVLSAQGLQNFPLFDTEGSWGGHKGVSALSDPDQEAGFAARYLMVQQSTGIQRLYWYAFDLPTGRLWNGSSLTAAGVAFQQVELWLTGATLSTPCSSKGTIWTCGYTRSGGYRAMAVWDTSQTCRNASCTTSSFAVDLSTFGQYQDLAGQTHTISSSTVPIGIKPILLQTGDIP